MKTTFNPSNQLSALSGILMQNQSDHFHFNRNWNQVFPQFAAHLLEETGKFCGTTAQRTLILELCQICHSNTAASKDKMQLRHLGSSLEGEMTAILTTGLYEESSLKALLSAWALTIALTYNDANYARLFCLTAVESIAYGWSEYARACSAERILKTKLEEFTEHFDALLVQALAKQTSKTKEHALAVAA